MSLTQAVADLIVKHPGSNADDLAIYLPNWSRKQIRKALTNAHQKGLLSSTGRDGIHDGNSLARYYPPTWGMDPGDENLDTEADFEPNRNDPIGPRYASVWDYAAQAAERTA